LLARGRIATLAGDWSGADRWFAAAARLAPSAPLADFHWAVSKLRRGDVEEAIAKARQAHAISPHFADPLELWGEALMGKHDYAGAIAKFAEADKHAPRWGRNHLRWGEALMLSGRYAEARRQYETANALDLSQPDRAALNVLLARTASGPLHG
jgi:tetratricopeptide (TPR) repeat protein